MSYEQPGAKPLMVVTGGSRGIGRAIVDKALATGYRVAVIDVDARALAAMTEDIGGPDVFSANVDITDVAAVGRAPDAQRSCSLLLGAVRGPFTLMLISGPART